MSVPVHHRGPSSCDHGPDPAPGVEEGQFETGSTLSVKVSNVGLLQEWSKKVNEGSVCDCNQSSYGTSSPRH